ncbi:MAG: hypothetical protein IIB16_05475 [Chloroflexi bacterium]|nr:hypothetical protein [Chloroflexota bacterium]
MDRVRCGPSTSSPKSRPQSGSRSFTNSLPEDINLIAGANFYGDAEKVVGITTEGRRDKLYLATKVRCEGKEAGLAQIDNSFSMLGPLACSKRPTN